MSTNWPRSVAAAVVGEDLVDERARGQAEGLGERPAAGEGVAGVAEAARV